MRRWTIKFIIYPQTKAICKIKQRFSKLRIAGIDGCDCNETLKLISDGKFNTEPFTHTYPLSKIDEAYELFENKRDGVIKIVVEC